MPANRDPARDMLFGLLALQTGLINQAQLVAAFHAWTQDRDRTMSEILAEQRALETPCLTLVEGLVIEHLRRHGSDPERSLAAIGVGWSTREGLARIGDGELDASLAHVGSGSTERDGDPDRTASYADGEATSDGQRFRILRPHARGGLGAVFVALDTELHREVALKQILDSHADEASSRHRFLLEAEITGGLEHPGIVPVYGLGSYGDGRPYYAMRFIRGDSFKKAIRRFHADDSLKADPGRRSLGLRQLLRRLTDVCNAIEYAHSRGVLHRDLKPGNVIVGKHGETLVVDWGVARAKGRGEGPSEPDERPLVPSPASGSAETLPGQVLGTPSYMSPEQARGDLDTLGPRSDVYSLGATLYCLLTGRPPFEGELGEILHAVRRGEFAPPRRLDPAIDKALEAVCLKAMATRPEDRYGSCRALADDVERWMADEPVAAYREPWTRTLIRWLTRHRTGVTAAAAALLAGLVGLGGVAAVQTRARNALDRKNGELTAANAALELQRRRAEANEAEAIDAVKRFRDAVTGNAELKNNPALEGLRKALLKEPLAFFGGLRRRLQADRSTRPEALARLAGVIHDYAHLSDEIGVKGDGLKAHDDSLAIWLGLARDDPGNTEYQSGLATIQNCRANFLSTTGRPGEALAAYERARAIQERLARDNPAITSLQRDLARSHNNIGLLLSKTGRPAEALAAHERARDIRERLARDNPAVTDFQGDLARSHNHIGVLLHATGHPAEALAAHERARAIQERLARDNPAVTALQRDLALSHYNIGNLLSATGRPAEALAACERARAIQERLARDNPAVTALQRDLALSHNGIGVLLSATGRPAEALAAHERARAVLERLARDNPAVTDLQRHLAGIHQNIGNLLSDAGRPAEALAACERARAIQERLAREHPDSPDHASELGNTLNTLATLDLVAKRFAEARDKLRQAIVWQKKALAAYPRHPEYRQFLTNHLDNLREAAQGLGDDALAAEARRGLDDLQASDPRPKALDARLAAVQSGAAPRDNAERLALAQRAYDTRRHATAARLWAEALDSDLRLAEDRQAQHRYNAACAAALAAAGRGRDEPAPDAAGKAGLRQQALGWLKGELAAWEPRNEKGPAQGRAIVAETLRHWRQDPDLAGVRDPGALAELPVRERKDWQALWAEVDARLRWAGAEGAGELAPPAGELPADPFAR